MLNLIKFITITLSCSIFFISGCSKSGNPDKSTDNKTENNAATIAALPTANSNTPLDQYTKLTSGNQLMFIYYGILNMPIDYDKIASYYSQDYRSTSDEFKKKDILNALKPRIDSEITKAKGMRYFQTDFDANLGHFNFNVKGFPVNMALDSNSSAYISDNAAYQYSFTNGEGFNILKVADEAKARSIETMIDKYPPMKLVFYVFTQDADPNNRQIKCQIVKVKLLDHQGNELLVQ